MSDITVASLDEAVEKCFAALRETADVFESYTKNRGLPEEERDRWLCKLAGLRLGIQNMRHLTEHMHMKGVALIRWFARGGGVKRCGPFKTQIEATNALRMVEREGGQLFPPDMFVWPEET